MFFLITFLRYQKKCDELEVQKGAFESQKDYEIKNKEQIILWLEGKLNRSGTLRHQHSDLSNRNINLKSDSDSIQLR